MLTALKNLLAALAAGLGLAQARDARKNSPEMQRQAQGATDQQMLDAANTAIAKQDIDAIRRQNS
jgi:hypothetical protein